MGKDEEKGSSVQGIFAPSQPRNAEAIVYLRRRVGNMWLIVNAAGTIISGPHRWGSPTEALRHAQIFCETWKWRVFIEDGQLE